MSSIAHAGHPIRSPLGDESVRRLLERGLSGRAARVLDLGCGSGEWLLRALTARPDVHAVGVDVAADALELAERSAWEAGVQDRLVLHQQQAEEFTDSAPYDVILSFGAAHVFGGLLPTLAAARKLLAPGGRVLVGDGFWQHPPSAEAIEMLGDFDDLAGTVDRVTADGWVPVDGHVSTREELDDYEWACWGSLADWALDHPNDPDSTDALALAAVRRTEWLHAYRNTWGFVSLVLRRAD